MVRLELECVHLKGLGMRMKTLLFGCSVALLLSERFSFTLRTWILLVVFNSGQEMALRVPFVIICQQALWTFMK